MTSLLLAGWMDRQALLQRMIEARNQEVAVIELQSLILDEELSRNIVEVLERMKKQPYHVVMDNCGAYWNKETCRLATTLGTAIHLQISKSSLLSAQFLRAVLHPAATLQQLVIENDLDSLQTEALADGVAIISSLERLNLRGSLIVDVDTLATRGFRVNKTLKSLILRSINVGDGDIGLILNALSGHPSLESLDLSLNHCQNPGISLQRFLESTPRLESLFFDHQNCARQGKMQLYDLAEGLMRNRGLKMLSLISSKLTDEDATLLASALLKNHTLRSLQIGMNFIGDVGLCHLSEAIDQQRGSKNIGIQQLNVKRNRKIGSVGLHSLLRTTKSKYSLLAEYSSDGVDDGDVVNEISYYTYLNRNMRRLLLEKTLPSSLWPTVLARAGELPCTQHWDIDVIFTYLTSPVFLANASGLTH